MSVISLGCKVNQVEGEELLKEFAAAGVETAGKKETADIIVINTCTVTSEADRKSRKLIHQAVKKKTKYGNYVVVTGCYSEVAEGLLKKIPGVDLVVPQRVKSGLVEDVLSRQEARGKRQEWTRRGQHPDEIALSSFEKLRISRNDADSCLASNASCLIGRQRAFLKIQDGCDNRCSYCIVPDARGLPRSLPEKEILAKARDLIAGETREIVLTGINLGKYENREHGENRDARDYEDYKDYKDLREYRDKAENKDYKEYSDKVGLGEHKGHKEHNDDLVGLIKELMAVPGLARIRLSSIEPEDVTDELIELLSERAPHLNPLPAGERESDSCLMPRASCLTRAYLCPHLHIPLQSGDEETLKRMGRRYTAADYRKMVKKLRAVCPDVAITTDVIVGFPGESEEAFQNTYRFLEKAAMARLHVFRYSKRKATLAAGMKNQIPEKVKAERSEALRKLSARLEQEYRKKFIGWELDILVEKASGHLVTGTSENYLTVSFAGDPKTVGQLVKVRLEE